jgi:hypothetical protein
MSDTTTVNFTSSIPAGADETLARTFSREARVTRLFAVAVPGEESDVERYWYVKEDSDRKNLLLDATDGSIDGESYLAGDDVVWDIRVNQEIPADAELQLRLKNNDGTNPYPNSAFAEVEFGDGSELIALLRRAL